MTTVTLNGSNYSIPAYGDTGWAVGTGNLSSYLVAIASGCLQTTGGTVALSANVNFGASYGLLAAYFSTRAASPATSGLVRLALTDTIKWGAANLALSVTGTDLYWNGNRLLGSGSVVSIAEGGTGASTAQDAITALAGSQISGRYLRSDGTHTTLSAIQAGDVPTLNQATTASSGSCTGNAATATTAAACSGNTAGTAANVTGVVAIANGGTGQITAPLAIAALLPVPTRQVLTTGTAATYTTPANVRQLRIRMVGGGGGGGSSYQGNPGGAGGDTIFNSIVAHGGAGGPANGGVGAVGAVNSGNGTGSASLRIQGSGTSGVINAASGGGGGASSPFGGAGYGGYISSAAGAAIANSGSGGGAGGTSSGGGGCGGGAGEYVELLINSPSGTYTYTIGAAGAAGTQTSGYSGADGGSGIIIVDEMY